ncbi:ferric hydroximate transport ferric iron reductase [Yersinia nurmii]|uniref:Ferric hydroximate transport ferric iron reductase n=1 Tax=Yersinia nurmii TaxID=685706 RepID=A0ABM9SL86_9GAMM|nr:siderophore-iron reductase FhuF [Yersinia nurmii]CNE95926.1 ferric hydroximate transport ferric iron reductase [Yersinia nurmii]
MTLTAENFSLARRKAIEQCFPSTASTHCKTFSASALYTPEHALTLISPLLNLHSNEDRTALVSKWSQWYFARLLGPWMRINLQFNWQLPILPEHISLTLNEAGLVESFILSHSGHQVTQQDPERRFQQLVQNHLAPVCRTLSQLAGMGESLFWNNAGIRLYQGMKMAQEQQANTQIAAHFLSLRTLSDGSKNTLFQPVRQVTEKSGNVRIERRLCCLRYRLSGLEICSTCPLQRVNNVDR